MSSLVSLRGKAAASIVLVDLPWSRDKDPRVPLGHASLLAALARAGVDARSIIAPVNETSADAVVDRVLDECRAPVTTDVAIGAYVWCEHVVQRVIRGLRERGFAGRIILGGPQISFAGVGVERLYPGADVFVRGYGEDALCDIVRCTGRSRHVGVHHAGEPDAGRQASVGLESLPSPWLEGVLTPAGHRFVRWETQRGCPYRCSFCQHREAGAQLKRRALAFDRVSAEARLLAMSGVEEIAVLDPIFNASPAAADVLDIFARHQFAGTLSLQCRAELVDERFLDAAARVKTRVELGLQTIHAREGGAVRRGNALGRVDAVLRQLRRRGIDHEVTLIFGLPEQTVSSFYETVRWCLERQVPVIRAFPLMLLRGTELDDKRDRWGLVDDGNLMARVIASNTFTQADWLEMARLAEALARTERHHPDLEALTRAAASLEPSLGRWQPAPEAG